MDFIKGKKIPLPRRTHEVIGVPELSHLTLWQKVDGDPDELFIALGEISKAIGFTGSAPQSLIDSFGEDKTVAATNFRNARLTNWANVVEGLTRFVELYQRYADYTKSWCIRRNAENFLAWFKKAFYFKPAPKQSLPVDETIRLIEERLAYWSTEGGLF